MNRLLQKISAIRATLLKKRDGAVSEEFSELHLTANSDAYGDYIQDRYYWGKQTTPRSSRRSSSTRKLYATILITRFRRLRYRSFQLR
jgi:hypothetical protein